MVASDSSHVGSEDAELSLYPLWLRGWHWANASLFLLLIVTGFSMHFSHALPWRMPFELAVSIHNFGGVALLLTYTLFVLVNLLSGNYRHYLPQLRGLFRRVIRQARFYVYGIFKGEPHPYLPSADSKFNPLQQVSYLQIMFVLLPVLMGSGLLLLFPELPVKLFGEGGLWPVALSHTAAGFLGALFMLGHIYLATTGNTVLANFRTMITGAHDNHDH